MKTEYKSVWVIFTTDNKIVGIYDSPEKTVIEQCEINDWNYSAVNLTIGDFKPVQYNFIKRGK